MLPNKRGEKDLVGLRSLSSMQKFLGRTKPKQNGCVEWQGLLNETGYGRALINNKLYMAHRISWSWANSSNIPEGGFICHSCDNRKCVNPEHLWLGDYMQNYYDSVKKAANPSLVGTECTPCLVMMRLKT